MDSEQIDWVAKAIYHADYPSLVDANWWPEIPEEVREKYHDRARAALAALPDCIPDLKWSSVDEAANHLGSHYFAYSDGSWKVDGYCVSTTGRSMDRTMKGARAACNKHNRAAIMSTFKKD